MDTGIGKEGYSLIGQGKIEAIFKWKARRKKKSFRRGCRIVKYKSRKEEAEKKTSKYR